jgi:hypothetical protein
MLPPLPGKGEELLKTTNALRFNYASSDKWLTNEKHYYLATFESKGIADLADNVRGAFQLRATRTIGPLDRSTLDFPFAYIDVKTRAVDFRVGKQILAWGRTDALNPTDIVTPRDYTTMLPFDEDERRGVWGVRSNVYAGESTVVSFFYGARFKPSTVPLPRDRFVLDQDSARRRQLGVRVGASNADFDFSVSAYRGASVLPQFQKAEGGMSYLGFPEIDMLGADFARNFGKYGFRIEGASVRPRDHSVAGTQPYRYLVAGGDRTFLSDLNVNVQVFGRWEREQNRYGMTVRVANQWLNQTLGAELFVQRYFTDGSMYVHPQLSYALSDHWKATAGAVWYVGDGGTVFGEMRRNKGLFGEVRYSF